MKLFSKKTTFLLGSVVGSIAGLLFARETGNQLRHKIQAAKSPQKKFEALFQEYLKIGKEALEEVKESEAMKDILKGGNEILAELKKKSKTESSRAVKIAQQKTTEIIQEVEKKANKAKKTAQKKVAEVKRSAARKVARVKKAAAKKPVKKKAPRKRTAAKSSRKTKKK